MKRLLLSSIACTLGLGAPWLVPATASACGGFFCDGGPQPMPVDQTGEDIIFVMGEERVEAHIRVEYAGEAQNFAWLIPVLSVPSEFSVGSETFFDGIKAASVPTYGQTTQQDACDFPGLTGGGFGSAGDGNESGGAAGTTGSGDPGGGPTIFKKETVGAFAIVVLGDASAESIFAWLGENGYQQDMNALPIIENYLATDHVFVAIKLNGTAGVEELHPISLTFEGPGAEACIPLQLTAIAAKDDMAVRTYFLGDHRVVPQNYRHVQVNPLKIDWPNQASNYVEVVTRAVDADNADGRAFVTEYAGTSVGVSTADFFSPNWNADAFLGLDPVDVLDELRSQGLFGCDYDGNTGMEVCQGSHAMVEPILLDYLIPDGVDPAAYYANPAAYAADIDLVRWNGGIEFAATLDERVVAPGQHAAELVQGNPYLTRMYTTISPHEMTVDPMFYENPDLEEVDNIRNADRRILCNGDSLWTLADGREVYVAQGDAWPNIGGEDYWEEEVDEMPNVGAPLVLVNNTAAINGALAAYNAGVGWEGSEGNGGAEAGDAAASDDGQGGCGCTSNPAEGGGWALFFTVGFGIAARRRRRRANEA